MIEKSKKDSSENDYAFSEGVPAGGINKIGFDLLQIVDALSDLLCEEMENPDSLETGKN